MTLSAGMRDVGRELLALLRETPGGRMKDRDLRERAGHSPAMVGSALQFLVRDGQVKRVTLLSGDIIEITTRGATS